MKKTKSDKLLDSIGNVSDRWVGELMEEPTAKASPKKVKPIVKRIIIAAAAALLCVSLVITVAANSDAIIAAIFERRQKLVDDKIGHIDTSATEGDITLTFESIKNESTVDDLTFMGSCTVSFHNEKGAFEKGLKYGSYKIQCTFDGINDKLIGGFDSELDDEGNKWLILMSNGTDDYDCFSMPLSQINYGLDNPSDTISLTSTPGFLMYGRNRITFYDITSADGSITYAKELSIEFDVTKETVKPLPQLQYYEPFLPVEIENVGFEVVHIDLGINRLYMEMTNPGGDTVNIGGVECCAINYLTKLANLEEFFEKVSDYHAYDEEIWTQLESQYDEKEVHEKYAEQVPENEELRRLSNEIIAVNKPTEDEKLLSECYELVVELNPECGAEVTSMQTSCFGWTVPAAPDTVRAGFVAEFSSPIYVDDIIRVYAQKIGDPTKQVTIWVPAEDKGLDAFR